MDESKAIPLILQFLAENGYDQTMKSFEEETGLKFESEASKMKGSELMNTLQEHFELTANSGLTDLEEEHLELETELIRDGKENFAKVPLGVLSDVHKANILSVRFNPHNPDLLVTGSTDKSFAITNHRTGEVLSRHDDVHIGAVLSTEFHPIKSNILATSSMDSTAAWTDLSTGTVVQKFSNHRKYVVRAKFSADGNFFATAAYDKTVCIYGVSEGEEPKLLKTLTFPTAVESIEFTPESDTLIIAPRECAFLQYLDLRTMTIEQICLNANDDHHVSFSAMDIKCSPSGKFLSVCTDRSRVIVYRLGTSQQFRNMYGMTNDGFSQPRTAWHPSGCYLHVTSQDKTIGTYSVANQKLVGKLEGMKEPVRDIDHHPTENILASVGFDKVVRLWGPESA